MLSRTNRIALRTQQRGSWGGEGGVPYPCHSAHLIFFASGWNHVTNLSLEECSTYILKSGSENGKFRMRICGNFVRAIVRAIVKLQEIQDEDSADKESIGLDNDTRDGQQCPFIGWYRNLDDE